jgi:hypothetical protein
MFRNGLSITIIAFMLMVCIGASAQTTKTAVDTPMISFKNKPKLFLTLDRTSSFVSGKGATTSEIRAGLEFKKKLRLGIGYAKLVSDVVTDKTITTQVTQIDSVVPAELSLAYFTMSGEYTFYESKRWQITMPVTLGIGSSYFYYYEKVDGDYLTKKTDKGSVVLFGPSGVATYRILRWVGLSAGLGFRFAIVNNGKIQESFNSPVYLFRVRIFMGEIYKTVFPRGVLGKHNPPYSNEYWD